jgi:hypothetical protein
MRLCAASPIGRRRRAANLEMSADRKGAEDSGCCRMLTYADVCCLAVRSVPGSKSRDVSGPQGGIGQRMLTYADVC